MACYSGCDGSWMRGLFAVGTSLLPFVPMKVDSSPSPLFDFSFRLVLFMLVLLCPLFQGFPVYESGEGENSVVSWFAMVSGLGLCETNNKGAAELLAR
ncbi:hypothetical protein TanjilG_07279 [Lupinus angustifolius]|uniref:Uncharacterized protein n=1 Tax=Lupinus angustifolius TaxID=3871 RepID=A0A394DG21_LUPAN|nr:hypothetical protein TanjilG_07279 [Lupinus angustifolius]